jgi:hypothetical protein
MNGHFILGLGDNDTAKAQISVASNAIDEAEAFLSDDTTFNDRFNRIHQAIDSFESPYGLELLTTVHWAAAHDAKWVDLGHVVKAVHNWSSENREWSLRKETLMSEHHIIVALERLVETGYLRH